MHTLISAVEDMISQQKQNLKYEQEEINNRVSRLDKEREKLFFLEQDLKSLKEKEANFEKANQTCLRGYTNSTPY